MPTLKDLDKELSKLEGSLRKLSGKIAGAGWDDRMHPSAAIDGSPISFAFLAYIHEHGSNSAKYPLPARKLLDTVARRLEVSKSQEIERIILTNLFKHGTISEAHLLQALADFVKSEIEVVMGDPSILLPNADRTKDKKGGRNTPLVDSGSLRNNIITTIGD